MLPDPPIPMLPRAPSRLPLLVVVAALAAVFAAGIYMSLDARKQAGDRAREMTENLVHVLERDVARNIEVLDLSLQAVVEGVSQPEVMASEMYIRKMILFDRSASATGLGALVVFDRNGRIVIDSLHDTPTPVEPVTDREYFQAQASGDQGLFISKVYQSRLIGKPVIGLSRRLGNPDGSFNGVAVATIEIAYLTDLIARLQIGPDAVVALVRADGTAILRQGSGRVEVNVDLSRLTNIQQIAQREAGTLVATSQYDRVERLYGFHKVGHYPLTLSIGVATSTIYADWARKTALLAGIFAVVSAAILVLFARLVRELRLRSDTEARLSQANLELERLSFTDVLTGIGNRRYFDDVLGRESRRARRTGRPLALVLIDVDHFKLFNDHYGHADGDTTLKRVAAALRDSLRRPSDMVFRVGGEEFAVILPETNEGGACVVAETMLAAVRAMRLEHMPTGAGIVTVSAGLAEIGGDDPSRAYSRTDAALYEAKRAGRDRLVAATCRLAA